MDFVTPDQVKQMFRKKDEFALLDMREEGVFQEGINSSAAAFPSVN